MSLISQLLEGLSGAILANPLSITTEWKPGLEEGKDLSKETLNPALCPV